MRTLPFDRFTLVTPKSVGEIEAALVSSVARPKWRAVRVWPFSPRPAQPYEGAVTAEGFKIWPLVRYRNNFLPVIVGRFEPCSGGVKIEVRQRLSRLALAFMALWTLLAAAFGAAFAVAPPGPEDAGFPFDPRLLPFLMMLFMWALAMCGFWWEARHTEKMLSKILDGEPYQGF
ncbi:MAG: hypothetical protein GC153_06605 [Alphaproteobacteria bacterium]|nr:hypothetical protein [Alphaproteobacteria bacterium]